MTQLDITARKDNLLVGLIAAVTLALLVHAQHKDEADDQAARVHVQQQAKAAAQPDRWAQLERK